MIAIGLLSLLGILVLFMGMITGRKGIIGATSFSILLALAGVFYEIRNPDVLEAAYASAYMNGMMEMDTAAGLFAAVILTCGLIIVPFAKSYERQEHAQLAEFCALMLWAMAGAVMMVTYRNLIMLFVGLEILSISVYILTGSDKRNVRSNEAALKYFLMGSFATGILLFGFALIYGSAGSFYLNQMTGPDLLSGQDIPVDLRMAGMVLVIVGILFKVSAAPFHFWTPDVYEGAPTVFTAFMSTVVKTAGFAALLLFLQAFSTLFDHIFWFQILAVSTVLTLLVGNLLALVQSSFKRMLAYSGISHAGYMLIALLAFSADTVNNLLFYSLSYGLATAAAFGVLILVGNRHQTEGLDPLRGLGKDEPLLAFILTVALASLGGIPLTAGFVGKLFIFSDALTNPGILAISMVAIVMSTVSVYYYFKVVAAMYMSDKTAPGRVQVSLGQQVALWGATAGTFVLGLAPGILRYFL